MDNSHDYTHLIDTHEEHNREDSEKEYLFEDTNENTIAEK